MTAGSATAPPRAPVAVIAEDEPLLAAALAQALAGEWPELRIAATVGDGASAVAAALAHRPEVLFLDVRMPGVSGLEAATQLADDWPGDEGADGDEHPPFPLIVFVTAYDQYAVDAFEAQAVDYVLKPVTPDRLRRTALRLRQALAQRAAAPPAPAAGLDQALAQLRALLGAAASSAPGFGAAPASLEAQPPLTTLQVGGAANQTIRMVPVAHVLCFEAADKYVRVLTAGAEHLIRTPLKELLPRLDAEVFWQVHRGTVVRASAIDEVTRDECGRLTLQLRGMAAGVPVSRLYAHRFKAM